MIYCIRVCNVKLLNKYYHYIITNTPFFCLKILFSTKNPKNIQSITHPRPEPWLWQYPEPYKRPVCPTTQNPSGTSNTARAPSVCPPIGAKLAWNTNSLYRPSRLYSTADPPPVCRLRGPCTWWRPLGPRCRRCPAQWQLRTGRVRLGCLGTRSESYIVQNLRLSNEGKRTIFLSSYNSSKSYHYFLFFKCHKWKINTNTYIFLITHSLEKTKF